jgi:hypothetical protein
LGILAGIQDLVWNLRIHLGHFPRLVFAEL